MNLPKKISFTLLVTIIFTSTIVSIATNSNYYVEDGKDFDPNDTLKVVTTLGIINDWAWEVGKGLFTPHSIVTGLEDPHTYEMTTADRELLSQANLLIRFGIEGIESWLSSNLDAILEDNPNLVVITLANTSIMENDTAAEEPFLNPHVWMSPVYAKSFVKEITDAVVSLDPNNKAKYEANRDNYLLDLDALIERINKEYRPELEGLKVVVHHPAFMYLFDLLGIKREAIIEEKHEAEPSPEHIQNVVDKMKKDNVKIIVVQPQVSSDVINQIVKETGAKLVSVSPLLPAFGQTTYVGLIEYDIYALQHPTAATSNASYSWLSLILFFSFLGTLRVIKRRRTKKQL